jgi:hypothetical protein
MLFKTPLASVPGINKQSPGIKVAPKVKGDKATKSAPTPMHVNAVVLDI